MKIFVGIFLSLAASLSAADNWVQEGNEAFYNLDYDQSVAAYEKALAAGPDDPILHNHLAHALLYREMFRDGALESALVSGNNSFLRRPKLEPPADVEKRFFAEIDRAIQLSQARIAKNPRDKVALHTLSVSFALRANYGFLVRKSWKASTRAIPLVTQLIDRYPRNYLLRFELAQMYASLGNRQNAPNAISEIARMKRENAAGYDRVPWEKIYYETGNLEFWFDDLNRALDNLKRVTESSAQLRELDLNTGVLALMRQGQIYDLQKRHNLAVKAYQQAVRFAPEAEAARESQHYINSPYTRPVRNQDHA
jgi:tetratricopeptide (TPR) repeat protein